MVTASERHRLEALAHLAGKCEQHRLPREVHALGDVEAGHVGDEFADAVADQEMRLRGVAGDPEAGAAFRHLWLDRVRRLVGPGTIIGLSCATQEEVERALADPAFCRTVAWRVTAITTAIVIGVALVGSVTLETWRVSVAAVVVSGSIIIFCQSLQMIMKPPVSAPPPFQPQGVEPAPLSLALACFPLTMPALVTAPGIAAIVVFMAIAGGDWRQTGIVLGVLLVIMALNLVALLNAGKTRRVPPPLLKVVGWVMAVLQAAEAVQYLFNGLVRFGVLPPLNS